ncbi:MAG: glycogen/starch synthase [Gemmatimonadales bacterium]|nr:glycogen/starch synthase [Gemmatimonadales bacterium]
MPPAIPDLPLIDGQAPMIVHLSAEYYPYARTGGLAEASWGLHRFQHLRGRATMAMLPLYRSARAHLGQLEAVGEPYTLDFGGRRESFRLLRAIDPASGTPTCFIEHEGFFAREGIYGEGGQDYPDNPRRFAAFAAAAVAALPRLTSGPVILHAHDWHAALAAVYLRKWWGGDRWFDRIPVALSVHNGGYQGHFPADTVADIGLPGWLFNPDHLEWYGKTNFLKGGLTHADVATTVSPNHARELCTDAGGFGLQAVYRALGDRFTGVLNGIDQVAWDPRTDPQIAERYAPDSLDGKRACKAALQQRFGLPVNQFVPVVALAGRLVTQKGLDKIVHNHTLFHLAAQFVFMGSGDRRYEDALHHLRHAMPHRVGYEPRFTDDVEHQIMAGADIFLMPSQYEPCGLTQMRAQRYGTIPVARRVGGLADTIDDSQTGFLFDAFEERAVTGALWRALLEHSSEASWREMQRTAMSRDFGWDRVADRYVEIYHLGARHRAAMLGGG